MSKLVNYIKECDILIVGGGGSGAIAALEAANEAGLKVIIVSQGPISQCGLTPTANGGTAVFPSEEEMFQNMINGGSYLNDQNIAWFMVNSIKDCLKKLEKLKIPYTQAGPKTVSLPCASSLRKLRELLLKRPNIELLEDVLVTRLLVFEGKVCGATALDIATGDFFVLKAKAVVIATGGLVGELYPHSSNNPFGIPTDAAGTGHMMALQAGAELVDMEMIQFVPIPGNPRSLHLRYYPEFWVGPYLNRDREVVIPNADIYPGKNYSYLCTQKLFSEIEKGKGPIYIDHRGIERPKSSSSVEDPRRKLIQSLGIDPLDNRIEIILGSHFGMGGIRVNEKTESTVPGLYAAGEVMGGVHGGMRIPGYSMTQIIVFGFQAGVQASNYARGIQNPGLLPTEDVNTEKEKIFQFLRPKYSKISFIELRRRLQNIMQEYVFISRDKVGLTEAIKNIGMLKEEASNVYVPDFKRFNLTWSRAIELDAMIIAAEIIAKSALAREESRGSHYRKDFPGQANLRWLKHTMVKLKDGRLRIDSAPVIMDRMKPEVSK